MKDNIKFIFTKLKMPVPRKGYIKRKELMLKLDSALEYKITLVKGPAARGKTTLVTSFISGKSKETWDNVINSKKIIGGFK